MTLARLRNLARLCHPVLRVPRKIQPTEPLLPLLRIFALNNRVSHGATQGQTPLPACRKDPALFEHHFGNLPPRWLGAGWVGSTGSLLLMLFCFASDRFFFSFSLRHMTPKLSDWGTTWDRVWKLGCSSYSDKNLNILY